MDWKGIVKTVAPVLGTALGGPLGGAATKFIADKLLGDPNASQDQIEAYMAGASPETLAKLKELDLQFKTEMRRLDVDLEKLEQADRQDARGLAKVDMRPHMVISAIYTAMYGLVLYCLLTGKVTVANDQMSLVQTIVGILTMAQGQILSFWFGSSAGSKAKDAALSA